jgi:two-component system cell cycle response regulator
MTPARVLVADDDRLVRAIFADALRAVGHHVALAANGVEALERLEAEPFDLLLTDLLMPEMDGLELLERAKQRFPALDVIVLTGVSTAEPAVQALRGGAFHYLVKPLDPEALQLEVHRCLENRRLMAENAELRRYQQLLGAAQRITACLELERLRPLAMDTLAGHALADAALLFRPATDRPGLEMLAARNLATEQAAGLAQLLWERHEAAVFPATEPLAIDDLGGLIPASEAGLRHIEHALFVPLRREGVLLGVALLLRRDEHRAFSAAHARDAAFLGESVALALENAERYQQAQWVAHLDALTGLYNARHLEHVVDREVRARQNALTPFSVLFMDLDHFKRVNDTHGHQIGSRVLVEISRLLRRHTRETDVLIRYGGDEFVVILPDADTETAVRAAERIRIAVEAHRFLAREGLELRLTLCCGVSSWPRHAATREDMIHRADMAMYHGKKAHRNAVYEYDTLPTAATPATALPAPLTPPQD